MACDSIIVRGKISYFISLYTKLSNNKTTANKKKISGCSVRNGEATRLEWNKEVFVQGSETALYPDGDVGCTDLHR